MKHRKMLVTLALSLFLVQSAGFAQSKCEEKVTSDQYLTRAPWRLMHGVVNLVSSPAHLIVKPVQAVKNHTCVFTGFGTGLVNTGKYAILGAWDIISFWVPGKAGKDMAVLDCSITGLSCASCCKKDAAK